MKLKNLSVFLILLLFAFACGGGKNVKGDKSLGEQRAETMKKLAIQLSDGLTKLDKEIDEAYVWNLKQVKAGVKGNKDVADEAELKLQLVKKISPVKKMKDTILVLQTEAEEVKEAAELNINVEDNPDYDTFVTKMKTAINKLDEIRNSLKAAMDEFQKQFKKLK